MGVIKVEAIHSILIYLMEYVQMIGGTPYYQEALPYGLEIIGIYYIESQAFYLVTPMLWSI